MVDRPVLARKVADVRDAVERIRSLLPAERDAFLADRTAREVVTLNLFVAIQECLALASHWLADEGWDVPQNYRDVFTALARHGVLPADLAGRLGAAAGLRNLIAHQYGALDFARIYRIASSESVLGDLLSLCDILAHRAGGTG